MSITGSVSAPKVQVAFKEMKILSNMFYALKCPETVAKNIPRTEGKGEKGRKRNKPKERKDKAYAPRA